MDDYEIARSYLEQHYFGAKLQPVYYEELIDIFPQCLYNGEGYRILFVDDFNEYQDLKKYSFFSQDLEGIKTFINHRLEDSDGPILKTKKIILLKAHIEGLDLKKCIQVLVKKQYYPQNATHKWNENEVVAIQISQIEIIQKCINIDDLKIYISF